MGEEVSVKIPASSANLGSGFDSIGIALQMYTTIHLKISHRTRFYFKGKVDDELPSGKDNFIYQGVEKLFRELGRRPPELEGIVDIGIPVARGLGSSGAAIVGGIVGANMLAGEPFKKEELFQFAAEMEGHPENVGASLFGGMFVSAKKEGGGYAFIHMDPPEHLMAVAFIPHKKLSTLQARHVLPSMYTKEDAIHALSHSALLVAAFAKKDWSLLWEAMDDRLHQPYREKLIPEFQQLKKEAKKYGALGIGISGAGPTIVAITRKDHDQFLYHMEKVYSSLGIKGTVKRLLFDHRGVEIQNTRKGTL